MLTVFSDCRPWTGPPPRWYGCDCGYIGKQNDAAYDTALAHQYADYAPFHQAGGAEQGITGDGRAFASRSSILADWLVDGGHVSAKGALLDYGCGNGSFLKAAAVLMPDMHLHAADISDSYQHQLLSAVGVETFSLLPLAETDHRKFDLISLVHVLEHVPDPLSTLLDLKSRLTPSGVVVIQVPNLLANPFDLIVADHLSHFTQESLRNLSNRAGLDVSACCDDVIPKELTLTARATAGSIPAESGPPGNAHEGVHIVGTQALAFLDRWRVKAITWSAETTPVSIFGTSIAGSWMADMLDSYGGTVRQFLDDDPAKDGHRLRGVEIVRPSSLPTTARGVVLVPLIPSTVRRIAAQLEAEGFQPVV